MQMVVKVLSIAMQFPKLKCDHVLHHPRRFARTFVQRVRVDQKQSMA
jgi:hypothetical protein